MNEAYDVAVVGAGVLGLAHAYHLAKAGQRVVVFERHPRAMGASVRNFGMIWPIGQPAGPLARMARTSRDIWLHVLKPSGLWHERAGSLHLAYREDEAQVLREFEHSGDQAVQPCAWLTPAQIDARFPAVRQDRLQGGLWSEQEVTVDPREVIAKLPEWLSRTFGVRFEFDTTVLRSELPRIVTTRGEWSARRLVICTGIDFRELAPDAFAQSGLIPCKLQMMRSQAYGDRFRVGTMLAAGLTLCHYRSFAKCPTLPSLKSRFEKEMPEFVRAGIHVMAAQNGLGEIVIGDSHEYGDAISPFDKPSLDDLILSYLQTFLRVPDLQIAAHWQGTYVKHPTEPFVVARPDENTLAVTGVGGAGMTLSFGLAAETVHTFLGDRHD